LFKGLGDNKGNRVADVAHLIAREDEVGRYINPGVRQLNTAGQRAEICRLASCEHKAHAWHCPGLGGIDPKPRMCVGRPQDDCMQRLVRCNVTDVASAPTQQCIVFLAEDRLAEPEFHWLHCHCFHRQKFACRNYRR
jgi:hypothetical protein